MPDEPRKKPSPAARDAFALARLRRSPVLMGCMVLAFLEYGALAMLVILGDRTASGAPPIAWFPLAGWLAICSLGSWFFLWLWYPALARMESDAAASGRPSTTLRVLEMFAVSCVAVVHLVLAWTLVVAVRGR